METETSDQLIDTETAAAICGVRPPTIRAWYRKGRLRAIHPGGSRLVRFLKHEVERLAGLREPVAAPVAGERGA